MTLNPASLNFGNQPVSTSSSPRSVTLTIRGNATLNISSIGVTGANAADFALSPTGSKPCSFGASTLAPGSSCTFHVTFTPAAAGTRAGNVTVTSNPASSPHNVRLSGTGAASAPAVSLSPSPVAFGNQPVGAASSPLGVALTNRRYGPPSFRSPTKSGRGISPASLAPAPRSPQTDSSLRNL